MKYLKKFETTAQYTAAQSSLILPNVSLIEETHGVAYNPLQPTPPTPSHEYVDLGLPSGTKWATMNVGASSITDYGNYYQYGYGAATYIEPQGSSWYEGEETPLAASADTATQVWGGEWHMPTKTQCEELIANTSYEWTTIDGVNGGKFTAQNSNYVFLPAGGGWDEGYFVEEDWGAYWISGRGGIGDGYAPFLDFNPSDLSTSETHLDSGLLIRPVMDA